MAAAGMPRAEVVVEGEAVAAVAAGMPRAEVEVAEAAAEVVVAEVAAGTRNEQQSGFTDRRGCCAGQSVLPRNHLRSAVVSAQLMGPGAAH